MAREPGSEEKIEIGDRNRCREIPALLGDRDVERRDGESVGEQSMES